MITQAGWSFENKGSARNFQISVQNSQQLLSRGNELYKLGEYKKAIILYQKAADRGGDREAASFNRGNCYYRVGDFSRAAAVYQKALRLSAGRNYPAMNNLAGVFFRLGEYGQSIALYRRYLKQFPTAISSWLFLADAYTRTGDKISAQLALEKAHHLDPDDVSILYQLSEIHVSLSETSTAIQLIENAYAQNPEETDFLFYLGDLQRMDKNYAGAAAAYRKGLALEPNNTDALYKLADVLEQDNKFFLAMDCLQKALFIKSDFTDAAIFLGNLAFDLKMWDRSRAAYMSALAGKNSEGIEGIRNIAFEFQKLGQNSDALALLEKALKLAPENTDLQTDLLLYREQIPKP